jgi:hypothetical protein
MDIPTDIPRRIRPDIGNPITKSVVYTFNSEFITTDTITTDVKMYRFPYSKNTFWTNYKYNAYGTNGERIDDLEMNIVLKTLDGETHNLTPILPKVSNTWTDTVWPIPSIPTDDDDCGVYIMVTANRKVQHLRIQLLGFMDLFPECENYMLQHPFGSYQYLFRNVVNYNQQNYGIENAYGIQIGSGEIYIAEEFNQIERILDRVVGILQIAHY